MDKNTITGILLMGLIFLGFMYLNRPSEEELQRQREQAEMQARQAAEAEAEPLTLQDSIRPSELPGIVATVRQYGRTDSVSGRSELNIDNVSLSVERNGELGGLVRVDGQNPVAVSTIVSGNMADIPTATAAKAIRSLRQAVTDASRYQGFARNLAGDSTTVVLENALLSLEISNKGGMISRAMLKDYDSYDSTKVALISPETDYYTFTLTTANQRFDTGEFFFTVKEQTDTTVTMALELGSGATFSIRYGLQPDSYLVTMDVLQEGMEAVIPRNVASMDFSWRQKMRRNEAGRMFEERNSAIYFMYPNGDVDNLSETSDDDKTLSERLKWVGYKNQFFSSVLMARNNFSSAQLNSRVLDAEQQPGFLKELQMEATIDYAATSANPAQFTLFLGPNSYPLLNDLQEEVYPGEDMHLTRLIPLGWSLFRWINTLIVIPVFSLLGSWIASYGIIILLLTIFIKIILFPFTYKSYMSQARMRVLAPEIKEINDKYPGNENAMKRQQETMALYSRAGASPFSGCLPMLLQMPILIAMFSFFPSAIELRGQSFLWAHDLSAPDAIVAWTANIPLISSTFGNHISLFCLLMTVTNIIYTKISMQSQPSSSAMPGMKWMMYLMPIMFLVFFNNYAAGLSYYYFLSLLITIVQTWIFRRVVNEDKVRAQMAQNARKPRKKSGFMARLEEAQRKQQDMLREQQKQQGRRR